MSVKHRPPACLHSQIMLCLLTHIMAKTCGNSYILLLFVVDNRKIRSFHTKWIQWSLLRWSAMWEWHCNSTLQRHYITIPFSHGWSPEKTSLYYCHCCDHHYYTQHLIIITVITSTVSPEKAIYFHIYEKINAFQ
jgi:hypothetical protein